MKSDVLSLNLNYNMTGDTQQLSDKQLAVTKKSAATAALSITIPLYNNNFCIYTQSLR